MTPTMSIAVPAITTADAPKRKWDFRGQHGGSMPDSNSIARRDPRLRDSLRVEAGAALRDAAGGTKRAARLLGVSERWARELVSGRSAGIVSQFLELVMHVADPWRLVALVHITAYRATMLRDSADELVRCWWAEVEESASDCGAFVARVSNMRRGVDLAALEKEAVALARSMGALAARTRELRRHTIDPADRERR